MRSVFISVFACFLVLCFGGGVAFGGGFVSVLSGGGTVSDPWIIGSLADFDEFSGDPNYLEGNVRLEVDIDLSGRTYSRAVIAHDKDVDTDEFEGETYRGVFDGNGHEIRNLTISPGVSETNYLSLFGKIEGNGAEIKNLHQKQHLHQNTKPTP